MGNCREAIFNKERGTGVIVPATTNSCLTRLFAPYLQLALRSIIYTVALTVMCMSPLLLHQYNGYQAFCLTPTGRTREWCSNTLPSIYSFVQAHYWNVGFLKYWTISQIPNFAMAAPPLLLILYSSTTIIRTSTSQVLTLLRTSSSRTSAAPNRDASPLPSATLDLWSPSDSGSLNKLPHALHALALSLILLFSAHTQIALRVLPTLPFMHWSLAQLATHREVGQKEGQTMERIWRFYIGWAVVWFALSCVLWSAFLPPA